MVRLLVCVLLIPTWVTLTSSLFAQPRKTNPGSWPQFGGSPQRNHVAPAMKLPSTWDVETGKNIKWSAELGHNAFGGFSIAGGKIFIGSNNGAGRIARYPKEHDLGTVCSFDAETGRFLWQYSVQKLSTGRVHDWPTIGICSTPVVEGERLWLVNNRAEIVCLDTEGFYDGEDDGPVIRQWEPVITFPANLNPPPTGVQRWNNYYGHPVYVNVLCETLKLSGVQTPSQVNFSRSSEKGIWILSERKKKTNTPLYHVHYSDDMIDVYSINDDQKRLAQFNANLLQGLDEEKLSQSLIALLAQRGIVLKKPKLQQGEEDSVWLLTGKLNDEQVTLRLSARKNQLMIEQAITINLKNEADVVWRVDMMKKFGVSPHNASISSPTIFGDVLFVNTSNGVDESHQNLPAPQAPAFLALDKHTGQVLWTDNSPGENVLHGQWSSPAVGTFHGVPQVLFAGGDGWLYSFRADRWKAGKPELLWKFDGNPKDSKWTLGGRGTRNNILAAPVIADGLVYLAMGQDPEHGEGPGILWCIDPNKRGDVSETLVIDANGNPVRHRRVQALDLARGEQEVPNPKSAVRWKYTGKDVDGDGKRDYAETMNRALSTPVIHKNLLIISDFSGIVHCLDAKTGVLYWTADLFAACWSGTLLVGDDIYVTDEDGDVAILKLSYDPSLSLKPERKRASIIAMEPKQEINMENSIYATPVAVDGVLYIATRQHLYAISETKSKR